MVKKFNYRFYIKKCLFGSVRLTKNADPGKYKYSDYGIGWDGRLEKECHYFWSWYELICACW